MSEFTSERVITDEIGINNCGIQNINNGSAIGVRNRVDYTLMYIAEGGAQIFDGTKMRDVTEGEAMLFLPLAEQKYRFVKGTASVNMWVHFGGTFCRVLDGDGARVIKISDRNEFESAFERLVRSYNSFEAGHLLLCESYLRVLIAQLCRDEKMQNENRSASKIRHCLSSVLNDINMCPSCDFDWNEYAARCYMSRDRFNHVFSEFVGCSPERYRTKMRMERAKVLLCDLGMSVSECAETLGFHDVSHFCRRFKAEFGASPGNYVKRKNDE